MTTPSIRLTETVGPADALLVVLGPSLGTSTILWEAVAPLLQERYRVCAWDLPGHGAGPAADGPVTVGAIADGLAAALRARGEHRILSAGVSLGGATGLELALRHPDLVVAAAIVASGARLGTPESWHERAAIVRERSTTAVMVASAERWFAPGSREREPDLTDRLLRVLQDADDESYARCCEALADYDVRARLGEIGMPVLALWGEHDLVAPQARAAEIAHGVVDGRAVMVPGVAHLPPAEDARATAAALLDFVDAVAHQA
ncbi:MULTISPECIES: alpha/beta fold hydrolase [unclassified Microcella]|uniref:alpha/beta fold hydrolase n=1 Tax=unclassified Microcella TaxID=2630066 RepID=UPI0006FCB11A|nr:MULTISPECIES: alpha/beta fold hydrolase [unclassified Microcella]KQV25724.1 alpha/beta hydrolase [Yonghaparkia sp. Root332]KRF33466.1 alpha/beta hydrolase [Yonghaparkia sp. Soil809]